MAAAGVAELADARDLKSRAPKGRVGSIPAPGTTFYVRTPMRRRSVTVFVTTASVSAHRAYPESTLIRGIIGESAVLVGGGSWVSFDLVGLCKAPDGTSYVPVERKPARNGQRQPQPWRIEVRGDWDNCRDGTSHEAQLNPLAPLGPFANPSPLRTLPINQAR